MPDITYFGSYHGAENHLTNNILLALKHLYRARPDFLSRFLIEFGVDGATLGPTFQQQVRNSGVGSVIDGLIVQRPFYVGIETKRGDTFDNAQITRHCAAASDASRDGPRVVIGLRTGGRRERPAQPSRIAVEKGAEQQEIIFIERTFDSLVELLEGFKADHEPSLSEMIDDLRSYLVQQDLLDKTSRTLAAIPCGTSMLENERTDMYYQPAHRSIISAAYIGAYSDKAVQLVGAITHIIDLGEDESPTFLKGERDDEIIRRCLLVAHDSTYGDLLEQEAHRFYVVDRFARTHFVKTSSYGVLGRKYINLEPYLGESNDPTTGPALAEILNNQTFR